MLVRLYGIVLYCIVVCVRVVSGEGLWVFPGSGIEARGGIGSEVLAVICHCSRVNLPLLGV